MITVMCKACGKEFKSFPSQKRIGCSFVCGMKARKPVGPNKGQFLKGHPSRTGCKITTKQIEKRKSTMQGRDISGVRSTNWKGGRRISKTGYLQIRLGREYFYEHRLIMESSLKRKLNSSEVVHHINNIKLDNRLDNLLLTDVSGHRKLHSNKGIKNG